MEKNDSTVSAAQEVVMDQMKPHYSVMREVFCGILVEGGIPMK